MTQLSTHNLNASSTTYVPGDCDAHKCPMGAVVRIDYQCAVEFAVPKAFFSRFSVATAAALFLLIIAPVQAGYYELVDGKGAEVCEAYEKNLNSFKPKVPMACARAINPEFPDFSQPNWTRGDAGLTPTGVALYTLYLEFGELLWERDANPVWFVSEETWQKWKATPEQMAEARRRYDYGRERSLSRSPLIAEFDIDNDGQKEPMYIEQPCGSGFASRLAVLAQGWQHIDRKKTELVTPHPPFSTIIKSSGHKYFQPVDTTRRTAIPSEIKRGYEPIATTLSGMWYDVFFFRGETYFDRWWTPSPEYNDIPTPEGVGKLEVFQSTPAGTNLLCSYRFHYE